jgi:hypothetical protein
MKPVVQVPLWSLVVTPIATILGTMLAVLLAAIYQNRAIEALRNELKAEIYGQINGLRAEMRQVLAELELRLTKQISELGHRIERLDEQRGLVRP